MNVFFVFLEIMICERFYMLYFLLLIYTSDYDCDVLIHVYFFFIFQVLQLQSWPGYPYLNICKQIFTDVFGANTRQRVKNREDMYMDKMNNTKPHPRSATRPVTLA